MGNYSVERVDTVGDSPTKRVFKCSIERLDTAGKSADKSDDYATTDWGTVRAGGDKSTKYSIK